jgi:hypothetical protein
VFAKGKTAFLHCIKWCIKIVGSGNIGCHLLGWFDAGGGGWVPLGVRRTGERRGGHGGCLKMQKGEMSVSGEFAKKVSSGSENFVLNTVGCCGVSIGESLEPKRRVRAV